MHSKIYSTCRLNGGVLQGVNAGVNIPVSIQEAGSMTASSTVNVVATYVCLTKISLVAYTGATWLSPPASISPIASVTAQLQPLQVLSVELCNSCVRDGCNAQDTTLLHECQV